MLAIEEDGIPNFYSNSGLLRMRPFWQQPREVRAFLVMAQTLVNFVVIPFFLHVV